VSDFHPLGADVLGRSGTPIASWFMNEADLLLVLGSSFSNHTGISTKHPIVQIDSDRTALARFHPVTVPVWGRSVRPSHAYSPSSSAPRSIGATSSPPAGRSGGPRSASA
jgi:thiamine pyrophosphate-dependent acetolactate synthase large subunit-like protein